MIQLHNIGHITPCSRIVTQLSPRDKVGQENKHNKIAANAASFCSLIVIQLSHRDKVGQDSFSHPPASPLRGAPPANTVKGPRLAHTAQTVAQTKRVRVCHIQSEFIKEINVGTDDTYKN